MNLTCPNPNPNNPNLTCVTSVRSAAKRKFSPQSTDELKGAVDACAAKPLWPLFGNPSQKKRENDQTTTTNPWFLDDEYLPPIDR